MVCGAVKKGIGRALERGIAPDFTPDVVPEEEISLLHNRKRLKILEYLANFPCASASTISKDTGISLGSVRWHLRAMKENGLIREYKKGHFTPFEASSEELCGLFEALHREKERKILDLLIERGALSAADIRRGLKLSQQLVGYHLKKLENAGLIVKEKRYYEISFDVTDIQERFGETMREFVANLLLKGKFQGVIMEMRSGDGCFVISVNTPESSEMKIYEVPFFDVLG